MINYFMEYATSYLQIDANKNYLFSHLVTSQCFHNCNKLICNCRELGDIHVSAREGVIDDIAKHLAAGVDVNMRGLCSELFTIMFSL
jgi:hypothetical protein